MFIVMALMAQVAWGQFETDSEPIKKFDQKDKFRQLEEILPTPNDHRTASGDSGHQYWQQTVDYVIDVRIDDELSLIHI